jgi:hypothetical protein
MQHRLDYHIDQWTDESITKEEKIKRGLNYVSIAPVI